MKNREQSSGSARAHKVLHPFLRLREFVEPLDIDHDHGKRSNPLALLSENR
jgi:hypothetical protein